MKYTYLTDDQLIELAKIRMKNDIVKINPLQITIKEKGVVGIKPDQIYFVDYTVKSSKFHEHPMSIIFDKFYPEEFIFLQGLGIDFKN